MLIKRLIAGFVSLSAIALPVTASAQFPGGAPTPPAEPVVDWQKHVTDTQRLSALGTDLMGDQIDYNTGSVSFEHTDVSLPGNSALQVAVKRRLTRGILYDKTNASEFGDWEVVVPRLSAITAEATNFRTGARCSSGVPFQSLNLEHKHPLSVTVIPGTGFGAANDHDYSQGIQLDTLEYGQEKVLRDGFPSAVGPYSSAVKYVTRNNFKIECLSNITGGGEGFLAVSPNGITYKFDRFYERHAEDQILSNYTDAAAKRYKTIIAATEVTDADGNWVKYDYDSYNRLTRIYSNDGRDITLSYTGANSPIDEVSVNGRVWEYEYTVRQQSYSYVEWGQGNTQTGQEFYSLQKVTLPDDRFWLFTTLGMDKPSELDACTTYSNAFWEDSVFITHPSGAQGEFVFSNIRRRVGLNILDSKQVYGSTNLNTPLPNGSGVTLACPSLHSINNHIAIDGGPGGILAATPPPPDEENPGGIIYSNFAPTRSANLLMYRPMTALVEKNISGPNMPTSSWAIDYQTIPMIHYSSPSTVPSVPVAQRTNWTKVVMPNGAETTYYYHWDAEAYGGELKRTEVRGSPGASSVVKSADFTYVAPTVFVGHPSFPAIYPPAKQRFPVFQTEQVIQQDGDTFTSETSYNLDLLSANYSFGHPVQTKVYSNVSTNPRITDTVYEHKTGSWILGLPLSVTTNGREVAGYTYNASGQKITQRRNEGAYATFGYGGDGTMSWFKDALHRQTSLLDWKRGTPQEVERADDLTVYQYVDDNGWTTSTVDAKSNTTSYSRDNMGRLTTFTPPTGRAPTTISYSFGANTTQTITNVNNRSVITYDALWRPTLVQTKDLSTNQSSFLNTTYDAAGQVVFTSFPSSSPADTAGTNSTYDALGRSLTAVETVYPGATTSTAYLSGHRRQVTDAESYVTTYSYTGYDGPSLKTLLLIQQPEDTTTTFSRNIWDEVETLNQAGTQGGSVNQTHTYIYDAQNQYRLCRHRTPESGDTLLTFDVAGQLLASARGMGSGSSCGTPSGDSKVSMAYNDLGLPTIINFTNGITPDIAHIYDANGNVEQTNRNGVNWTYTYDNHNALTSESLALDGKTFASSYTYNTAGHMVSRTLPSGRNLSYNSDGLGRPVTISSGSTTYASGMAYYPSGTLSNMTYGNGQAFSQSLNARLQPEHLLSQYGTNKALDLTYIYGDKRGKVTAINNGAISGDNRTYDYDGQGRLTTSTGPWGSGAYSYDPLGNIRTKTEGSRALVMSYDGNNHMTSHTDSAGPNRSLSYDVRGNVTALGGLGFTYDMSDQPISISGSASGTYKYDGNLKRVKSVVNGKIIYNVYDASGKLIHIDQYETVSGSVVNEKTDYIGKFARITNNTVIYLHNDLLGSAQTGSSANGLVSWREQFMPFGETMNNPMSGDDQAGYTGHIKDSATGLNYMQARYYDPLIGRFLSTDPVGFSASRPEMFGRYTYVGNDPINANDPTGMVLKVVGDDTYKTEVAADLDQVRQSESGAAAVSQLEGSENLHLIVQPGAIENVDNAVGLGGNTTFSPDASPGSTVIAYNARDYDGGVDDSGSTKRHPSIGLGHEIGHAQDTDSGLPPGLPAGYQKLPGTTPSNERNSLKVENEMRTIQNHPPRSSYIPKAPILVYRPPNYKRQP